LNDFKKQHNILYFFWKKLLTAELYFDMMIEHDTKDVTVL